MRRGGQAHDRPLSSDARGTVLLTAADQVCPFRPASTVYFASHARRCCGPCTMGAGDQLRLNPVARVRLGARVAALAS